jgi:putative membrane protein
MHAGRRTSLVDRVGSQYFGSMTVNTGRAGVPPLSEPDYRMSLAAERTYLAYQRTALALSAAGVAVVGALPGAGALTLRRITGALLVLMATMVAATARIRWLEVDRAMRQGAPLPPSRTTLPLSVGVTVVTVLGLVAVASM